MGILVPYNLGTDRARELRFLLEVVLHDFLQHQALGDGSKTEENKGQNSKISSFRGHSSETA